MYYRCKAFVDFICVLVPGNEVGLTRLLKEKKCKLHLMMIKLNFASKIYSDHFDKVQNRVTLSADGNSPVGRRSILCESLDHLGLESSRMF